MPTPDPKQKTELFKSQPITAAIPPSEKTTMLKPLPLRVSIPVKLELSLISKAPEAERALQPVVSLERLFLNMTKGLKANWGPLHQLAASMANEWNASKTAGPIIKEILEIKKFEHRELGKFKISKIEKDIEEKSNGT